MIWNAAKRESATSDKNMMKVEIDQAIDFELNP